MRSKRLRHRASPALSSLLGLAAALIDDVMSRCGWQ
jgi:hypothetical protein